MAKVIHVHLLHKIDGTKQKDWYFSSIYGSDGRSGGGNQELPASCRAVW